MFLDNARSQHAKLLKPFLKSVKRQLEVVFLPPYSPNLSEIEKLWQEIKSKVLYNGVHDSHADFENGLKRAFRRKNGSSYIRSLFDEKKYLGEEILSEA